MIGKKRRMNRILRRGRTVILPMDHGVTKPEKGIDDVDAVIECVCEYIDAVVLHKGLVKHSKIVAEMDAALIVHLSASTALSADPNDKRTVTSVEKAMALGAEAVSIHVNVGSRSEGRQLEELGRMAEVCDEYGMPLLAMMYPRGEGVEVTSETVKHAARIAYELGADIVKVPYTDRFYEVTAACKIPVVIAGGSKSGELDLFRKIESAMASGAAGVAVGRNVFSASNPRAVAEAIYRIVHEGAGVEDVVRNERGLVASR